MSDLKRPSSPSSSSAPRKRPRSETSPEERKEARAHRNRIAAQNSRDRRKAHLSYLERRVTELEEENRNLRLSSGRPSTNGTGTADQENQELRERIRTLEKGWDAVIKALAAQGLPGIPLPTPPASSDETAPQPNPVPQSAEDSFRPGSDSAATASNPLPLSPAPSDSSLQSEYQSLDFSPASLSSPLSPSLSTIPTRHSARVATIPLDAIPLSRPTRVGIAKSRLALQRVGQINDMSTAKSLSLSSGSQRKMTLLKPSSVEAAAKAAGQGESEPILNLDLSSDELLFDSDTSLLLDEIISSTQTQMDADGSSPSPSSWSSSGSEFDGSFGDLDTGSTGINLDPSLFTFDLDQLVQSQSLSNGVGDTNVNQTLSQWVVGVF